MLTTGPRKLLCCKLDGATVGMREFVNGSDCHLGWVFQIKVSPTGPRRHSPEGIEQ